MYVYLCIVAVRLYHDLYTNARIDNQIDGSCVIHIHTYIHNDIGTTAMITESVALLVYIDGRRCA